MNFFILGKFHEIHSRSFRKIKIIIQTGFLIVAVSTQNLATILGPQRNKFNKMTKQKFHSKFKKPKKIQLQVPHLLFDTMKQWYNEKVQKFFL